MRLLFLATRQARAKRSPISSTSRSRATFLRFTSRLFTPASVKTARLSIGWIVPTRNATTASFILVPNPWPIRFDPILALRGSSRRSACTNLCARTPFVQEESRRNSSTSCPVVVLLPFDHHVRGNSGVVRWPQSADDPLLGNRAKQRNVSHFNVAQGQNQVDALIELRYRIVIEFVLATGEPWNKRKVLSPPIVIARCNEIHVSWVLR